MGHKFEAIKIDLSSIEVMIFVLFEQDEKVIQLNRRLTYLSPHADSESCFIYLI